MKSKTWFTIGLAITAATMVGQTKPTFEVASIRLAAPLDMPIGPHVDAERAEYTYSRSGI